MPTATTSAPTADRILPALYALRDALGREVCYGHRGRYHFKLNGEWTLAISADSADRFRIETCYLARPMDTLWVLADDTARLVAVAEGLAEEAAALA